MVEANRPRRFDVTFEIDQLAERVVVSAAPEALQTDRADLNFRITSRQTASLVLGGLTGRDYQSLMAIVPGADV